MLPKSSNFLQRIHRATAHFPSRLAAEKKKRASNGIVLVIEFYASCRQRMHEVTNHSYTLFFDGPNIPGGSCSLLDQVRPLSYDRFMQPLHLNFVKTSEIIIIISLALYIDHNIYVILSFSLILHVVSFPYG